MSLIKDLREKKGLSREELAEQVGVSVHSIKNWEGKRRMPNRLYYNRLATVLGCEPGKIIDDIADYGR